jgi:hypothetical protein
VGGGGDYLPRLARRGAGSRRASLNDEVMPGSIEWGCRAQERLDDDDRKSAVDEDSARLSSARFAIRDRSPYLARRRAGSRRASLDDGVMPGSIEWGCRAQERLDDGRNSADQC